MKTILLNKSTIRGYFHYAVSVFGVNSFMYKAYSLGLPLLPFICLGKRFYSSSPVLSEHANFYDWFRGFTDAEGSFNISTVRNKFYSFSFEINLHIDDIKVLNFIKNTLGFGKVYKLNTSPRCKFSVSKQSEVKKIIEIFSIYSLNSSKYLNFLVWVEAFNLYTDDKESSAEYIFNHIKVLKEEMNTNRTVWNRNKDINITPYWLLGFVEGDGSFSVSKENNFLLIFTIAQTMKDLPLKEAIKNYLNSLNSHFNDAVYLTMYKSKTDERSDMINLVATKSEFISQVLLPFFQNLRWVSKKELDFVDWMSILKIKQLGIHHMEQGVAMIQRLIGQMNNNRSNE
uniref:LAGLIDADG endonuclease n=1 Tax=Chrysoporthe deuterocubensis TaxID=764597 RepID=A0A191MXC1_9PEZI|nr:LAGLIDADG endonuclease [Chrysoporthe deuterocubensis]AMX22203.1 LAGLIDADG endonuclease [Chrysoporthe deuterocubensis]